MWTMIIDYMIGSSSSLACTPRNWPSSVEVFRSWTGLHYLRTWPDIVHRTRQVNFLYSSRSCKFTTDPYHVSSFIISLYNVASELRSECLEVIYFRKMKFTKQNVKYSSLVKIFLRAIFIAIWLQFEMKNSSAESWKYHTE